MTQGDITHDQLRNWNQIRITVRVTRTRTRDTWHVTRCSTLCPLPGTLLPCEHQTPALVDWSFIILKLLARAPAPSPPQLEQGTAVELQTKVHTKINRFLKLKAVVAAPWGPSFEALDSSEQVHVKREHEVPSLQLHPPGPGHHGGGHHLHHQHRGGKRLLLLIFTIHSTDTKCCYDTACLSVLFGRQDSKSDLCSRCYFSFRRNYILYSISVWKSIFKFLKTFLGMG